MTKQEFINTLEATEPNDSLIGAIDRKFSTSLPDRIGQIVSTLPQGGFLDGDDFCRVMSTTEIVAANETLHTDFVGKQLIPLFDLGDNVFVVFDCATEQFGRFSLNDELVYRWSEQLDDIL